MIRIHLVGGDHVDTHLHTHDQATAAKTAGVDIVVGGIRDTWYGPEDRLGADDTSDLYGKHPERTIPASAITGIEEVGQ